MVAGGGEAGGRDPQSPRRPTEPTGSRLPPRPVVFRALEIVVVALRRSFEHGAFTHSAALAFYALLSLPGVILIVTATAAAILGEQTAQERLAQAVTEVAGVRAAETTSDVAEQLAQSEYGRVATLAGALILLFGATGYFAQLQEALNVIWEVKPTSSVRSGALAFISARALSLLLIVGLGGLLVAYLAVTLVLGAVEGVVETVIAVPYWILRLIDSLALSAILVGYLTLAFRILPKTRVGWRHAFWGAVAATVLFLVGRSVIDLWLVGGGVATAYSAGGTLIALMLWVNYSSALLLLGAEISKISQERASARGNTRADH